MKAQLLAAVLAGALPETAFACGACIEDKVAATYDHAVVARAAASGEVVVFCEVRGPLDAARLMAATRRARGVEARSVRVSTEPAALSFAVDPKQQSPQGVVDAVQHSSAGTRLTIVRVLARN